MNGYEQEQEWDAFPPGALPAPQPGPQQWSQQQWPQQEWAEPAHQQWQQPGYQQWPQPGYQPGPAYGPGWWHPSLAWPDGPERPGPATAAAVLGFVTAGLTLLFSLPNLVLVIAGEAEAATHVLLLGIFTAAGLITGAARLLGRKSPDVLFGSAVGSVTVLLLAVVADALTIDRTGGLTGILMFVFVALPLPVVTACLAWRSVVRGWAADQQL
jgi:hypothetical protein